MIKTALTLAALLAAGAAGAQDPVATDGDKYRVLLENEFVRVLEYRDKPGEKTHRHAHPHFVLYAASAFKRHIHLPDGKVLMREFKAGDVMWSPAQTHVGENIGTTETRVIMVELKSPPAGAGEAAKPAR